MVPSRNKLGEKNRQTKTMENLKLQRDLKGLSVKCCIWVFPRPCCTPRSRPAVQMPRRTASDQHSSGTLVRANGVPALQRHSDVSVREARCVWDSPRNDTTAAQGHQGWAGHSRVLMSWRGQHWGALRYRVYFSMFETVYV